MYRYLLVLFSCVSLCARGQVTVRLQAPAQTEVGDQIRVSYVVNTSDVEDFKVEKFQGFDELYGPSTSKQSNFQMVNGKTTSSSSVTFTYVVMATQEGTFRLPVATVQVEGKTYKSKSQQIEVLPASSQAGRHSQGQQGGIRQPQQQHPVKASEELYITATASKTQIYEQEAVLLTYKLYTLVNIQQLAGEMPQLDGFHVQEIDSKAQMSLKYERVNGRNYGTTIWRQYVLFPQRSGKLTVPPITFEAQVEVHNTSMDPFDVFFGGGSLTQLVKRTIKAPALEIDVKPLPQPKPANFNGAVGDYTLSGSLTPSDIKANDAATLRLVVSGHGNMKLMKAPTVKLPKDFEVYDPKVDDKTTYSAQGAKGNVVYDYIVVPRHGGDFTVQPVEFCYFDPQKGDYKTLRTDSFHVHVQKVQGVSQHTVVDREELKVIDSDIHFIKLGKARIRQANYRFWGSVQCVLSYVVLLLVFCVLALMFRRYARQNANLALQRNKKASREAARRLKNAARLLKAGEAGPFYDEVSRALLGYAGDKLNLRMADLTRDNVKQALTERGVDASLVDCYINLVNECEFARYAPGDPVANMEKIYSEASDALNRLNGAIKK